MADNARPQVLPARPAPGVPVVPPEVDLPFTDGNLRALAGANAGPIDTLLELLNNINGQDCYDAEAAAVGSLSIREYLRIPIGFAYPIVPVAEIGLSNNAAATAMTTALTAQIYAMNKAACPEPTHAVRFAILRVELIRAGWLANDNEVEYAAPPTNRECMAVMVADAEQISEALPFAKKLALLLPLATEHTFRTMGHHFISSMADTYMKRYAATFRACVLPELSDYLPPGILYHTVSHWVGPKRAYDVISHETAYLRIPDALITRATAAPAGCALVTTSTAIIEAIKATGQGEDLETFSGIDLTELENVSTIVRNAPTKYHKAYFAYEIPGPTPSELSRLEEVKEDARILAPILQGFLDSLPRSNDLAQARAIDKYANANPIMRKRSERFFKSLGRAKASSIAELFKPPGVLVREIEE